MSSDIFLKMADGSTRKPTFTIEAVSGLRRVTSRDVKAGEIMEWKSLQDGADLPAAALVALSDGEAGKEIWCTMVVAAYGLVPAMEATGQ